jgi:transcriptional regulator with XRE-family HTH domain
MAIAANQVEIGRQLRAHRLIAQRSVTDVATAAGMSQSKLSRLELGRLRQSEADIRRIGEVLNLRSDLIESLVNRSHDALLAVDMRERQLRHQLYLQEDLLEVERNATSIKNCAAMVLTGLTQTAEYASAIYDRMPAGSWKSLCGEDRGSDEFLVTRMRRQAALLDRRKTFEILIPEVTLLQKVVNDHLMVEQIDRLIAISNLPNVDLGIVPAQAALTAISLSDFVVFDDSVVAIETLTERLVLHQPQAVRAHVDVYSALSDIALSGDAAIVLLEQHKARLAAFDVRTAGPPVGLG